MSADIGFHNVRSVRINQSKSCDNYWVTVFVYQADGTVSELTFWPDNKVSIPVTFGEEA